MSRGLEGRGLVLQRSTITGGGVQCIIFVGKQGTNQEYFDTHSSCIEIRKEETVYE